MEGTKPRLLRTGRKFAILQSLASIDAGTGRCAGLALIARG